MENPSAEFSMQKNGETKTNIDGIDTLGGVSKFLSNQSFGGVETATTLQQRATGGQSDANLGGAVTPRTADIAPLAITPEVTYKITGTSIKARYEKVVVGSEPSSEMTIADVMAKIDWDRAVSGALPKPCELNFVDFEVMSGACSLNKGKYKITGTIKGTGDSSIFSVSNYQEVEVEFACNISQFSSTASAISISSGNITVSGGEISAASNTIVNKGTVTVSGGKVLASSMEKSAIVNESTGTVTVSGGTVSAVRSGGTAIKNSGGGKVTVSGGTVSATAENGSAIVNESTGTVTVSGGTVSAEMSGGTAIKNSGTGIVAISGTSIIDEKVDTKTSINISGYTGSGFKVKWSGEKTIGTIVLKNGTAVSKFPLEKILGRKLISNTIDIVLAEEKVDITIKVEDKTISYGETYTPNYIVTGEFLDGDSISSLTGLKNDYNSATMKNAKEYTITPSGNTNTKYNVTYQIGKLTIKPKVVKLEKGAPVTKVYDGNTTYAGEFIQETNFKILELVGTETLVVNKTGAVFNNANVLDAKTVTISGITLVDGTNGGVATNYSLESTALVVGGTITPKAVTVSGANDVKFTKTYDGNSKVYVDETELLASGIDKETYYTFDGILGDEDLILTFTSVAYNSKDVIEARKVTMSYDNVLSGTGNENYKLTAGTIYFTGKITPKAVTISGANDVKFTKTYDGNSKVYVDETELLASGIDKETYYTFDGILGDEDLILTFTSVAYNSKDVTDARKVTMSYGETLSGTGNENYKLTAGTIYFTGKITPLKLTIDTIKATDRFFLEGNLVVALTGGEIKNAIVGDKVTITYVGTIESDVAGKDKAVTVTATLDGDDKGNYSLPTMPTDVTVSIKTSEMIVKITTSELTLKEYGQLGFTTDEIGIEVDASAFTVTNKITGEKIPGTMVAKLTQTDENKSTGGVLNVGAYSLGYEFTATDTENYEVEKGSTGFTITISPKALTSNDVATITITKTEKIKNTSTFFPHTGGTFVTGAIINGDIVSLKIVCNSESAELGTQNVIVTQEFTGVDSTNYTLEQLTTANTVTIKELTGDGLPEINADDTEFDDKVKIIEDAKIAYEMMTKEEKQAFKEKEKLINAYNKIKSFDKLTILGGTARGFNDTITVDGKTISLFGIASRSNINDITYNNATVKPQVTALNLELDNVSGEFKLVQSYDINLQATNRDADESKTIGITDEIVVKIEVTQNVSSGRGKIFRKYNDGKIEEITTYIGSSENGKNYVTLVISDFGEFYVYESVNQSSGFGGATVEIDPVRIAISQLKKNSNKEISLNIKFRETEEMTYELFETLNNSTCDLNITTSSGEFFMTPEDMNGLNFEARNYSVEEVLEMIKKKNTTPTVSPTPTPTPTPTAEPEDTEMSATVQIIIGLGVLLLVALIILIIFKRKKN